MANRTNRTGPKGKARKPPRADTKAATRREQWKPLFLAALAESGNVSAAIKAAKVSRDTVYAHQKSDKDFAEAWLASLEEAMDGLEAEAWRRAKDGVDEPVISEGQLCFTTVDRDGRHVFSVPKDENGQPLPGYRVVPLTKKKYSDGLMTLLLRAGRPSKFRDNVIPTPAGLGADDDGIVLVHTAPPPAPAAAAASGSGKATKPGA